MLLSFRKPVSASSVKENFLVENIVDEDARTAWVAASNQDEWVQVDLQNSCQIHAIQINYDEYGASQKGFVPDVYQGYVLSASRNGKDWYVIADKSEKRQILLMITLNLKFLLMPVSSNGKIRLIRFLRMSRCVKYVFSEKDMEITRMLYKCLM